MNDVTLWLFLSKHGTAQGFGNSNDPPGNGRWTDLGTLQGHKEQVRRGMERTPRNHREDMGMRPKDGRQSFPLRGGNSLWILHHHEGRIPVQGRSTIQRVRLRMN